jgi:hypothetical protein
MNELAGYRRDGSAAHPPAQRATFDAKRSTPIARRAGACGARLERPDETVFFAV